MRRLILLRWVLVLLTIPAFYIAIRSAFERQFGIAVGVAVENLTGLSNAAAVTLTVICVIIIIIAGSFAPFLDED